MTLAAGWLARLAKRVAVSALILGGTAACVAMLAVMLSTSAKVTGAAFPGLALGASTSAQARPAEAVASTAELPKADDGVGASVANAMTAVGTAVAAVTLILSVGTTWFAVKLKDVETMTRELERTNKTYQQRLLEMAELMQRADAQRAQQEDARRALTDARFALRQWVDRSGASTTRYSLLADLSAHLEMLMSPTLEQRRRSFGELCKYLPGTPGATLGPVHVYALHCHALHGGTGQMHGLWCDIFSPVERAAFLQGSKDETLY